MTKQPLMRSILLILGLFFIHPVFAQDLNNNSHDDQTDKGSDNSTMGAESDFNGPTHRGAEMSSEYGDPCNHNPKLTVCKATKKEIEEIETPETR